MITRRLRPAFLLVQVVASDRELEDYDPADIALALCRMVSYNIGHLAYLNAKRYNMKRIFFGGFFIRGHPYTMETLSFAIRFWSKVLLHALLSIEHLDSDAAQPAQSFNMACQPCMQWAGCLH